MELKDRINEAIKDVDNLIKDKPNPTPDVRGRITFLKAFFPQVIKELDSRKDHPLESQRKVILDTQMKLLDYLSGKL